MITSRLASKAQTTIPEPVRAALNLNEGDEVVYEIRAGEVLLSRANHDTPRDDSFGEFCEWDSEADRCAYADL